MGLLGSESDVSGKVMKSQHTAFRAEVEWVGCDGQERASKVDWPGAGMWRRQADNEGAFKVQ